MSAGDLAKWLTEVAKHKRQQRADRWKRRPPAIGPGMLRVVRTEGNNDHLHDHPGPPDAA